MRPIGFSTGALTFGQTAEALELLSRTNATAVELSALREQEFHPLLDSIGQYDLRKYRFVSLHLPSSIHPPFERDILSRLNEVPAEWPLIVHPNIISDWAAWGALGPRLCVENMDKRKPIGQTAQGLSYLFEKAPDASFCFDIGHAHQVDPTMGEAVLILERYTGRLRQIHVSEVNSQSRHDPISLDASLAFSSISELLPPEIPVIIESVVPHDDIESEMRMARTVLDGAISMQLTGD